MAKPIKRPRTEADRPNLHHDEVQWSVAGAKVLDLIEDLASETTGAAQQRLLELLRQKLLPTDRISASVRLIVTVSDAKGFILESDSHKLANPHYPPTWVSFSRDELTIPADEPDDYDQEISGRDAADLFSIEADEPE